MESHTCLKSIVVYAVVWCSNIAELFLSFISSITFLQERIWNCSTNKKNQKYKNRYVAVLLVNKRFF